MARTLIGNIKGPKGDTGATGATGPQGPAGAPGVTSYATASEAGLVKVGQDLKIASGTLSVKTDSFTTVQSLTNISPGETLATIFGRIRTAITKLIEINSAYFNKANVYNGLDKTDSGYALDARQGTALAAGSLRMHGTVPNGTNLNTITEFGTHFLNADFTYTNMPGTCEYGTLIVIKGASGTNRVKQIFLFPGTPTQVWIRNKVDASNWREWTRLALRNELDNYALASALSAYVQTANIANNLTTTASGKVLDARQGKALNDSLTALQNLLAVSEGTAVVPSSTSFTVSRQVLRKSGNIVTFSFAVAVTTALSSQTVICTLPSGFRPATDIDMATATSNKDGGRPMLISSNGQCKANGAWPVANYSGTVSFMTS